MDFVKILAVIILWYPLFGIPAAIGFFFGYFKLRNKVKFTIHNFLILILPWLTWIALTSAFGTGKSLANVVEAIYLGLIVATLSLIGPVVTIKLNLKPKVVSLVLLFLSCVSAIILWYLVPGLPE